MEQFVQISCVIVGKTPRCVNDNRALEERLFTLNASGMKPQAHGNRPVKCIRVSLVKDISEKKERQIEIPNEIATCHTKQER